MMAQQRMAKMISGTLGLSGATDTALILRRQLTSADGTLFVAGRDIEENEGALAFDPETGRWTLLGDARVIAGRLSAVPSSTRCAAPTNR